MRLRHRGGPAVGGRGIGILCLGVKALRIKGDELQSTVYGKAVRIRGKTLLGDEVLNDELLSAGEGDGVFNGVSELRGIVHPPDALAARGISGTEAACLRACREKLLNIHK